MRLNKDFFRRDALEVAPELVGKTLVRRLPDGTERRLVITETEAYCGVADTACHAHKGRTKRTETLYMDGGTVYVYLCYGMHWLMNVVTAVEETPQAVLIRACAGADGPGKLTKFLGVTGAHNHLDIASNPELWIEDEGRQVDIITDTRVGIGYAAPEDQAKPWRFKLA